MYDYFQMTNIYQNNSDELTFLKLKRFKTDKTLLIKTMNFEA